jgi:hypothetical protein
MCQDIVDGPVSSGNGLVVDRRIERQVAERRAVEAEDHNIEAVDQDDDPPAGLHVAHAEVVHRSPVAQREPSGLVDLAVTDPTTPISVSGRMGRRRAMPRWGRTSL